MTTTPRQMLARCCVYGSLALASITAEGNLLRAPFGQMEIPSPTPPRVSEIQALSEDSPGAAMPVRETWLLIHRDADGAFWGEEAPSWLWTGFVEQAAEVAVKQDTAEAKPLVTYVENMDRASWRRQNSTALSLAASFSCGLVLMFATRKLRSRWI